MTNTFSIISPEDGRVVATRPYHSSNDIQAALEKTRLSNKSWQQQKVAHRHEILQRFAQIIDRKRTEISNSITAQMGRPIRFSPGEVSGVIERATKMLEIGTTALQAQHHEHDGDIERYITRVPLGTILIIAPWNYPFLTIINSLIPALLSGNTVLLKHSQSTALCAEILVECLEEAGLPKGVCQYLHMSGADTEKLLRLSSVDGVVFTGSVAIGSRVEAATAGQFIPSALELGGKDAAYVRQDANIAFSAENLVEGALFNSGQSCCGIERIYVHENVYDEFIDHVTQLAKAFAPNISSNPKTIMGPVINAQAAQTIKQQQDAAIAAGARPLLADASLDHLPNTGTYLNPQFLLNVTHDMAFMQEETFGPNAGIIKVTSDEQAAGLINDSEYGLTASVWTQDKEAARALGMQINTGTIFMNRCDYLDPSLTWSGTKNSGKGQSLGEYGYHQVTRPKSFHLRSI